MEQQDVAKRKGDAAAFLNSLNENHIQDQKAITDVLFYLSIAVLLSVLGFALVVVELIKRNKAVGR